MKSVALGLALAAGTVAAINIPAMAATIYAENFGEPSDVSGNLRFGSTQTTHGSVNYTAGNGWTMECPNTTSSSGPFGIPATGSQYAGGPSGAIQYDAGASGNEITAVNSGTPDGAPYTSYGRAWYFGFQTKALLWTSEYQVDLGQYSLNSVSWYNRQDSATISDTRVALEIGTQWYVSDLVPGAQAWTKQTTSVASTNWHTLAYTQGTSLQQAIDSATVTLPTTGTVTGFGVYFDSTDTTGIIRIDSYAIDASVPEPASLGLTGLAGLALLRRQRRGNKA
jgi:hypothetical protein